MESDLRFNLYVSYFCSAILFWPAFTRNVLRLAARPGGVRLNPFNAFQDHQDNIHYGQGIPYRTFGTGHDTSGLRDSREHLMPLSAVVPMHTQGQASISKRRRQMSPVHYSPKPRRPTRSRRFLGVNALLKTVLLAFFQYEYNHCLRRKSSVMTQHIWPCPLDMSKFARVA